MLLVQEQFPSCTTSCGRWGRRTFATHSSSLPGNFWCWNIEKIQYLCVALEGEGGQPLLFVGKNKKKGNIGNIKKRKNAKEKGRKRKIREN
jgi:hypothetical protein